MKPHLLTASAIAAGLLLAASGASAQYTTQVGVLNLDPQSRNGTATGPFTPADALGSKQSSLNTAFFSLSMELDERWNAQLVLPIPRTHLVNLQIANPAGLTAGQRADDGLTIATVKQAMPTLFFNYSLVDNFSSRWRPFIGIGLNYTFFNHFKSTSVNDRINGGTTTGKMEDSAGVAAQLGLTYKMNSLWSLTGAWSTADVRTTATTNTLGVERKTNIQLTPNAFVLALGYAF